MADWIVVGIVDLPWRDFEEEFGVKFIPNDGRYEASGPVAYAAIEVDDGQVYPLEHHYGYFNSRVLVYGRREIDVDEYLARLAAGLGLSPGLVRRSLS